MEAVEIGNIKIEDKLPEVFKRDEVREEAAKSLGDFRNRHEGDLPLKFKLEEFCFQRKDQICTVDSSRKYIGWDGKDEDLTKKIFSQLSVQDIPLVLRSHPFQFGIQSPTLHLRQPADLTPDVYGKFFSEIDRENTVVQLLKNPFLENGLFLCRPTFIYNQQLREEIQTHTAQGGQSTNGEFFSIDAPDSFVGLRILPVEKAVREKKDRLGAVFIYNPSTKTFEISDGFPYEEKSFIDDEEGKHGSRYVTGRTVDFENGGGTTLHYNQGPARVTPLDSLYLNSADGVFLKAVLEWQLPRIFNFEEEIHQQDWIPKGLSNTHQFVIFPPQSLGDSRINTQYYDFRPHESMEEMESLAKEKGRQFSSMSSEDKIKMFF